MTYYEGSLLQVEWTAQHGCGAGHENVDCDLVLQYMCHPKLRDGTSTETITKDNKDTMDNTVNPPVYKHGMNEPYEFFDKCKQRTRNKGLFAADQQLGKDSSALRTRQDNNENDPHGFECTEERDYWPYWHPTPWRDVAVLTSNTARCDYFKKHSFNVEGKNECSIPKHNNEADCTAAGGNWIFVDGWGMPAPECVENTFSRDNHNGNGKTGYTNAYSWEIPKLNLMGPEYINDDGTANCAFRLRYNISTEDYLGWGHVDKSDTEMIDSRYNDEKSPVRQNPYVGYGTDEDGYEWQLRLALNTDQYGRTFQDRSYMFKISKRPVDVTSNHRIINLNVRGKRGNIVEAYPAVEYDFVPTRLILTVGDYLHIQWTGCDTNPNYAGEGKQGTDRSNIVQLENGRHNYPMKFEDQDMFDPATAFFLAHANQFGGKVCDSENEPSCCRTLEQLKKNGGDINQNEQNCMKLNADVAYVDGGLVKMTAAGTYNYMSTRNNNFTNRSQKGTITVEPLLGTAGIVVASAGAAGFVAASGVGGLVYYGSTHPASAVATMFSGCKV